MVDSAIDLVLFGALSLSNALQTAEVISVTLKAEEQLNSSADTFCIFDTFGYSGINYPGIYFLMRHENTTIYLRYTHFLFRLRLASNIIPDIQKSIKDLEKSSSDMSSYQESYKYILDFLPTTPAFHFNFNDDNNDIKKLFKDEYTATTSATHTPYAVDDLLCKLNDNSQDQTPVRQLKSIQKNSSQTARSTNLKLDCPVKIDNVKKTQMSNPQANNKSSRIPRYNLSNCNVENTKDCISNIERKSPAHDIENKSKAQEILLEQIALSVLNVNKENVGSSSDEEYMDP
ncbi:uncharacterized protein LOC136089765 [Hydra vulgaris]|uniref:Uncharacterized protein LOC136089765 n=1 Tax=Hydra vulgaris TaxID=6087 RepID=A0ABM4DC03_HYDVU